MNVIMMEEDERGQKNQKIMAMEKSWKNGLENYKIKNNEFLNFPVFKKLKKYFLYIFKIIGSLISKPPDVPINLHALIATQKRCHGCVSRAKILSGLPIKIISKLALICGGLRGR